MGFQLDYRAPARSPERLQASRLAVVSLVFGGLAALLLFVAWRAALDVWRVPGFYMNWITYSFAEGAVCLVAGVGLLLAVGAILRKRRRRAAAIWGLAINGLLLLGTVLLRVLVVNPMQGF
jgi:hypothetical protein